MLRSSALSGLSFWAGAGARIGLFVVCIENGRLLAGVRKSIILSNVGVAKNPATPALARGRFFNMRLYAANCLLLEETPPISDISILQWYAGWIAILDRGSYVDMSD